MRFLFGFTIIILAGCARSESSSVLKLRPDTYTKSVWALPAVGGSSEARKIALSEANEYGAQLDKEILVINIATGRMKAPVAGKAEIAFRCLAKADPELQRLDFRHAPDLTIEDRRK